MGGSSFDVSTLLKCINFKCKGVVMLDFIKAMVGGVICAAFVFVFWLVILTPPVLVVKWLLF